MKRNNLIGKKFNRLEVLSYLGTRTKWQRTYWLCQCDCGNMYEISGINLTTGSIKSCGCWRREKSRSQKTKLRHGHMLNNKASLTYKSWNSMKNRAKLTAMIKKWRETKVLDTESRKDEKRKDKEFIVPGPTVMSPNLQLEDDDE